MHRSSPPPWRRPVFVMAGAGLVVLVLLVLLLWLARSSPEPPPSTQARTTIDPQPTPRSVELPERPVGSTIRPDPRRVSEIESIPEEKRAFAEDLILGGDEVLARIETVPEASPEAVHALLEYYLIAMKPPQGLPTGSHEEILDVLLGRNAWGLPLFSPDHPALDREGRLTDPWGSPFFFHVESSEEIVVRSAGPDREMWNEDDLIYP